MGDLLLLTLLKSIAVVVYKDKTSVMNLGKNHIKYLLLGVFFAAIAVLNLVGTQFVPTSFFLHVDVHSDGIFLMPKHYRQYLG